MRPLVPVRIVARRYTPFLRPCWGAEEWEAVATWRAGGDLTSAPAKLAAQLGERGCARPVLAVSGRAAIRATLQAARLAPGSEVIIPTYCCAAVAEAVVDSGLEPVLADVDGELNIELESTQSVAGPSTSAVVVVHIGGVRAAEGRAIADWARDRGALVIEDVAQGSPVELGEPIGDATVFSSGPGKIHFGPGGGWVHVSDEQLRDRVREQVSGAEPPDESRARLEVFLARYPSPPRGLDDLRVRLRDRRSPVWAHGRRWTTPNGISDVDAAIATAQVGRGPELVAGRRRNAARWRLLLKERGFEGVMAPDPGWASKVWVRTPGPIDELAHKLWRGGVEMERLYTPLHLDPRWVRGQRGSLARADDAWRRVAALPVRPDLDERDWARISRAVRSVGGA